MSRSRSCTIPSSHGGFKSSRLYGHSRREVQHLLRGGDPGRTKLSHVPHCKCSLIVPKWEIVWPTTQPTFAGAGRSEGVIDLAAGLDPRRPCCYPVSVKRLGARDTGNSRSRHPDYRCRRRAEAGVVVVAMIGGDFILATLKKRADDWLLTHPPVLRSKSPKTSRCGRSCTRWSGPSSGCSRSSHVRLIDGNSLSCSC